jgi:hypothetical protein
MDSDNQYEREQELVARVPQYKKEEAAKFLKTHFTEIEKGQLKNIYEGSADKYWFSGYHFTAGMSIRNVLRENGYGEDYFGIDNLDYIYVCSNCGGVIYVVRKTESVYRYEEELINFINAHLLDCVGVQEKIEVPTVRMIRV